MKTNSLKCLMMKVMSVLVMTAILLTSSPILAGQYVNAASKNYKQIEKKFYTLESRGAIKSLDVYGRDEIRMVYDTKTKKIIYSVFYQKEKNIAKVRVVEKGGYTLKKYKGDKKWEYRSVWYLNFKVLPKPLQAVAVTVTPYLAVIADLGRFVKVTYTYELSGNGTIKRTKSEVKLMVPSNLKSAANKLLKLFMG